MTELVDNLNKGAAQEKSLLSKIKALNEQAWEFRSSQPERARLLAQQAYELSQTASSLDAAVQEERAASLVVLGFVNRDGGKLDVALSQIHESLTLLENIPPSKTACDARLVLAWTYIHIGDYSRALEYATQAQTLARELGLRNIEATALDAEAYIYYLSDDPTEALKHFDEGLQIVRETGDLYRQCFILNNMSLALMAAGKQETALACGEESLRLARKLSLFNQELNVADTIAQVLLNMGSYSKAVRYLEQALKKIEKHDPGILQVYLMINLGKAYMGLQALDQATPLIQRALSATIASGSRAEQATCHQLLSEIFEREGHMQEAFQHFKQFHALNKSVTGQKAAESLNALKIAYQVETARREAEIYQLRTIELQHEIEERKQMQTILEKLATLDSLTQLYNRRHFYILAQREMERALRYRHAVSAVILDIDHFKFVNDNYGHSVGDQALRVVASVIQDSLRTVDIVGRLGGEEFAVLFPETPPAGGLQAGERIRKKIAANPIETGNGNLWLTVSVGAAGIEEVTPDMANELDELLKRADNALYEAKQTGRNRTVLY